MGNASIPLNIRRRLIRLMFLDAKREQERRGQKRIPESLTTIILTKLLADVPSCPKYKAYIGKRTKALLKRLEEDCYVQDAARRWVGYDSQGRKDLLIHVSRLQAEVFSHRSFRLNPARAYVFKPDPDPGIGGRQFGSCIWLNTTAPDWDRFSEKLRLIIHETTHEMQEQIAFGSSTGRIPVNSPFYDQAHMYKDYFLPHPAYGRIYLGSKENRDAYLMHPIEREAREVSQIAYQVGGTLAIREIKGWLAVQQPALGPKTHAPL